MSKEDLTPKDFVGHILQAADRILQYTRGMSREEFFADTLKQDAVIRNIEIIGEAANNLLQADTGIAARYPSIPFAQIYGMRNRVAHG
ncbi:MAG: HepT-like ribonuclease domain-containing protein, partial [Terracidiphilus sp.]